MKIGIDVSQMCYAGTGVARYVRGLTEALLTEFPDTHFVLYAGVLRQRDFFTTLARDLPWSKATWRLVPIPPKLATSFFSHVPIPFEALTGQVDLLHTSDWAEPLAHAPKVTTVHDLVFRKYPETVAGSIRRAQSRRLSRLAHNQTIIIADSESTKNDLVELYHLDPMRITVVYPGIDTRYQPQSGKEIARVKKKYNLPDSYLLSVGTKEPRKNLPRLLEACAILRQEPGWESTELVLTGRAGWGEALVIPPGVRTTGYVDEVDLPGLYAGARVFAYPSLYEGFGFPVVEAKAVGVPVVTSNVSSLPEVGGQAAVLVDPLHPEAIAAGIVQADRERENRIALGFTEAKAFTWARAARATMDVYTRTIESHKS